MGVAAKTGMTFNAWMGMLSPDEAAAEALKWQARGFRSAKIKVGGRIEADRERVKAVRAAVGNGMALRIDANAGYDVATSIRLAHYMEPFNLQLFQQPAAAEDIEGLARAHHAAHG